MKSYRHWGKWNPQFLIELLQELVSHKNILSNMLQTVQIYGSCLGTNIQILKKNLSYQQIEWIWLLKELTSKYSKIYEDENFGEEAIIFGRNELVWDYLLSPTELAHKIGRNFSSQIYLAKIFAIILDLR